MLTKVKLALRVVTDAFDEELNRLIASALADLGIAGVDLPDTLDDICATAVITYCKMHFGEPADYDRLKRSYDEQKAQLSMCSAYHNWVI